MTKILLPVDGSANSLNAVRRVAARFIGDHDMEVHLLHVCQPLSQHIARFVSPKNRASLHRENAEKALAPAREMLRRFGVPNAEHVELGDRARTINGLAQRLRVSEIVMGTARKNSLTRLIEDSVTNRVIQHAQVPVEVVAGDAVSKLERFGVPAGIAAALALLVVAVGQRHPSRVRQ